MASLVARRQRSTRWIASLAGAGLIAALIWKADPAAVWHVFRHAGWWMAVLIAAPVVGFVLHATAWWLVLPPAIRPPWRRAASAYVAAQTVDDLIFGVAGEPLKVLALAPGRRDSGWSALVVDNAAQLAANLTFLVAIAAAVAWPAGRSGTPAFVFCGAIVLSIASAGALLVAGHARRLQAGDAPGAACVPTAVEGAALPAERVWTRARGFARKAHGVIRRGWALARHEPRRFFGCFVLHLLGKAWMVAELVLALAVVGAGRLDAALALASGASLGALAGAPMPGQLGALEAAYGASGVWIGVPLATATAVALLRRIRSVAWAVVGLSMARSIAI